MGVLEGCRGSYKVSKRGVQGRNSALGGFGAPESGAPGFERSEWRGFKVSLKAQGLVTVMCSGFFFNLRDCLGTRV